MLTCDKNAIFESTNISLQRVLSMRRPGDAGPWQVSDTHRW